MARKKKIDINYVVLGSALMGFNVEQDPDPDEYYIFKRPGLIGKIKDGLWLFKEKGVWTGRHFSTKPTKLVGKNIIGLEAILKELERMNKS